MESAAPPRTPDRRQVLWALGVLLGLRQVGRALMPTLLSKAPLSLIALSPLPAHLLLVAPLSGPLPFVAIVSLRRLLAAAAGYYLGRAYGDAVQRWLQRRDGLVGRVLRLLYRGFQRAPHAVVLLLPNFAPTVAGMAGMPVRRFVLLDWLGQLGVAVLYYLAGDALSEFILPVVDFLREHMLAITAISVAVVLLLHFWQRRRGPRPMPFVTPPDNGGGL